MSGDSPDELESVQKVQDVLLDDLKLTLVDVLELSLEGSQELNKVLSLRVLLDELLVVLPKVRVSIELSARVGAAIQDT